LSRWAVRPLDLLQAFNEVQPDIVHFSGHGSRQSELILEDDDGNAKPVSEAALVNLFRTVKDNIQLVLLNACHSDQRPRQKQSANKSNAQSA
jgi:CHAT domain-containing protein